MKKVLMKILFMAVFILITANISISFAKDLEIPEKVRIGLYYSSSAKDSIELEAPYGMYVGTIDENDNFSMEYNIEKGEKVTISKSKNKGAVLVSDYDEIGDEDNYPYFVSKEKNGEALIKVNGKTYRGNIQIKRLSNSDMTIINHIDVDDYLYGVVPREIGAGSHEEALKAQAIIARTYVVKNLKKRSKLGFDFFATVDDQAYGGYEWENEKSNKAVDDTKGQIATYKGSPISAFYFSTSGGYTEEPQNVWGGEIEYLKSVKDIHEPVVENTTWEVTLTADEVKSKLAKHGIDVGEIIDLIPTDFSDVGRVIGLKIVGTEGTDTLTKSRTREYLELKSQWYTINDEAPVLDYDSSSKKQENDSEDEEEKEDKNSSSKSKTTNKNSSKNKESDTSLDIEETDNKEVEDNKKDSTTEDTSIIVKKESGDELTSAKFNDNSDNVIITTIESGENIVIANNKSVKKENHLVEFKKALVTVIEGLFNLNIVNKIETTKQVVFEPLRASKSKSIAEFTFRGRGWGHAVGMSQVGAIGMANNGFSAEEIIKWYFTGVDISK